MGWSLLFLLGKMAAQIILCLVFGYVLFHLGTSMLSRATAENPKDKKDKELVKEVKIVATTLLISAFLLPTIGIFYIVVFSWA